MSAVSIMDSAPQITLNRESLALLYRQRNFAFKLAAAFVTEN
jgi:hypothetical protein